MGYEHSVITTGETIVERFAGYSFQQEHQEGYAYEMNFLPDGTPSGGVTANTITVPFSNVKTGVFTYDLEQERYLVEEYGKPYVDGNTGEQVGVTNVLILKTRCSAIPGTTRAASRWTSPAAAPATTPAAASSSTSSGARGAETSSCAIPT